MRIAPVSADLLFKVALIGVAVLGIVWAGRKVAGVAGAVASDVYDTVTETADNVIQTPVYWAGDAIGIPRTNLTQCQIDRAAGATWDASFSCPAGTFFDYLTSPTPTTGNGASGSW